jgi:hypothetical protein
MSVRSGWPPPLAGSLANNRMKLEGTIWFRGSYSAPESIQAPPRNIGLIIDDGYLPWRSPKSLAGLDHGSV